MHEVTLDRQTQADAGEVLELLVTVFDDTQRAWFEALVLDPPYPESTGFVARAGGRIVSHVELLDMPLRYGEAVIHLGGVSGVATLPEWRRRGLVSALLQRLIDEMAARQMPLSRLGTGSPSFYERLGWSDAPPPGRSLRWEDARAILAPAPASRSSPQPYSVAPYAPADLDEMRLLYERFNAGRPGTLLRPERYWRSVMRRWLEVTEYPGQRNAVYVARREGRLVADCFVFTEEDSLYLSEVAYDEPEAVGPLLQAVIAGAGRPDPRRLAALVPWEQRGTSAGGALPLMGEQSEPIEPLGVMWRINDLVDLLRQVQPVLEQRLQAAPPLEPRGGPAGLALAIDRGEVALELTGSGLRIEPSPAPGAFPRYRLAQNDLVSLVLGSYASPDWLDGLGLPEAARPLVERLFPPAGGVFWLTDGF